MNRQLTLHGNSLVTPELKSIWILASDPGAESEEADLTSLISSNSA